MSNMCHFGTEGSTCAPDSNGLEGSNNSQHLEAEVESGFLEIGQVFQELLTNVGTPLDCLFNRNKGKSELRVL